MGTSQLTDGNLVVGILGNGTLNISDGGTVQNCTGILAEQPGSSGNAVVTGTNSLWSCSEDLFVGGGPNSDGGTASMIIEDNGTVFVNNTLKIWENDFVQLDGGFLQVNELDLDSPNAMFFMNGGTLTANTITNDFNQDGGNMSPGLSPGSTDISGNYLLNNGSIKIEIGGTTPVLEYDQINVLQDLTLLNASLSITVIDDFTPNVGDSFNIVNVDGLMSGTFSGLPEGARLTCINGVNLIISYLGGDGNDIVVLAADNVLLGDVNQDGNVNLLDVGPFVEALSMGDYLCEADTNQDGAVNLLDVDQFIDILAGN